MITIKKTIINLEQLAQKQKESCIIIVFARIKKT